MTPASVLALLLGLTLGCGLFLLITHRIGVVSRRLPRRALPWRTVCMSVVLAAGGFAITMALTNIVGLAVAVAGLLASIPSWLSARKRRRVQANAEASFPEVIEGMIARLRSGDTLLGALSEAAQEAPPPVSNPVILFARSYRLTGNAEVCLDELKRAWADPTGDLLVETVRVAHATGGANTLEILRELADQVRKDRNLRRDIEAKQSWVRVAARVGVAAPWVVLVFLSLRPEAASAYNSPAGLAVLLVGLALSVTAYWAMIALGRAARRERVFDR